MAGSGRSKVVLIPVTEWNRTGMDTAVEADVGGARAAAVGLVTALRARAHDRRATETAEDRSMVLCLLSLEADE